jgi:branched-chain amino acid transport system substrate-binding protein
MRGKKATMTRNRLLAAMLTLALAALVGAGCGDDDDDGGGGGGGGGGGENAAADCTASIGLMAPITGDAAPLGEEQRNWGKFGLDRFNEANGTKFKLVEGDTQLDPGQASTVAQQMVSNDAILGVVGPAGSQEVDAVGPVFDRAKLGFVSQSATATELTNGDYPTFSRVVPPDKVQGPTDAAYIADELGAKKVVVVDDQTSYSTGIADVREEELKKDNVAVQRESVSQKATDFSAIVSRIPDDADVVFLPWQLAANAQQVGKQMQEQGKDAVIFGSDGLFSPDDFSIEGSYVSAFAPDITSIPESKEVSDAYTKEYGEFGTFGPPTYAAMEVIATAILAACEEGEPDREAVSEQIRQVELPQSLLGQPIRFDENGDLVNAKFFIFTVKKGNFELVE